MSQLIDRNIDLGDKKCLLCGSSKIFKPLLRPSFAAQTGSTVHKVLEMYAKERSKGNKRDWKQDLIYGLSKGWEDTPVPNYYIAKAADFTSIEPQCQTCQFNEDGICKLSQESLIELTGCPLEVFQRLYNMVESAIERYDEAYQNKLISVEQKFDEVISHDIGILGFFDAVFEHDKKTIEIVDYKSGNYTRGFEELMKAIQPRIYSLAAKKLYPDYETVLLTFDYFIKKPITVTFTDEEDEATVKFLSKKWKAIKNRRKLIRHPPEYFVCRYMCDREVCDKVWDLLEKQREE